MGLSTEGFGSGFMGGMKVMGDYFEKKRERERQERLDEERKADRRYSKLRDRRADFLADRKHKWNQKTHRDQQAIQQQQVDNQHNLAMEQALTNAANVEHQQELLALKQQELELEQKQINQQHKVAMKNASTNAEKNALEKKRLAQQKELNKSAMALQAAQKKKFTQETRQSIMENTSLQFVSTLNQMIKRKAPVAEIREMADLFTARLKEAGINNIDFNRQVLSTDHAAEVEKAMKLIQEMANPGASDTYGETADYWGAGNDRQQNQGDRAIHAMNTLLYEDLQKGYGNNVEITGYLNGAEIDPKRAGSIFLEVAYDDPETGERVTGKELTMDRSKDPNDPAKPVSVRNLMNRVGALHIYSKLGERGREYIADNEYGDNAERLANEQLKKNYKAKADTWEKEALKAQNKYKAAMQKAKNEGINDYNLSGDALQDYIYENSDAEYQYAQAASKKYAAYTRYYNSVGKEKESEGMGLGVRRNQVAAQPSDAGQGSGGVAAPAMPGGHASKVGRSEAPAEQGPGAGQVSGGGTTPNKEWTPPAWMTADTTTPYAGKMVDHMKEYYRKSVNPLVVKEAISFIADKIARGVKPSDVDVQLTVEKMKDNNLTLYDIPHDIRGYIQDYPGLMKTPALKETSGAR